MASAMASGSAPVARLVTASVTVSVSRWVIQLVTASAMLVMVPWAMASAIVYVGRTPSGGGPYVT